MSVIVTSVLLKLARMWAMAFVTFLRTFFFLPCFAVVFTVCIPYEIELTSGSQPGTDTTHAAAMSRYQAHAPASGYLRSLTPFFPATVFLTPLRVRALVFVRCPRTGRLRR